LTIHHNNEIVGLWKRKKGGYSKRPLWQWVVIYLVVGAIVYGVIYYFVFAKGGGYNNSTPSYGNSSYSK